MLLIAKSRKIAAELGATFRSRGAKKIYWAMVEGVPKPAQGRISMFLAKGPGMGDDRAAAKGSRDDIERMRVARHGDPDAQHSLTLYAVVDKVAPRLAWLSMRPITGRTHQLRAHCEAIGHPIIGDPKYNRRPDNDPARADPLRAVPPGVEPKLHLLARRLILPHPRGGMIDVVAPLPPHMQAKLRHVRLRGRAARSDRGRAGCLRRRATRCAPRRRICGAPTLRRFYQRRRGRRRRRRLRCILDGRPARTPGKRPLVAPTRAIAESIAAEWAAQGETIEPMSMPVTRLANSAIDGVAATFAETQRRDRRIRRGRSCLLPRRGAGGARRAAG